jgi:transcriptional regulator CtsR
MREFKISPDIKLGNEIDDMIIDFKIKLQSFKDDEKILNSLLDLIDNTFSDTVRDEILKSTFDKNEIRNIKLKKIIE